MNASRLREILEKALQIDLDLKLRKILNNVTTGLSDVVGSPSDSGHQQTFASAVDQLRTALSEAATLLSPAEVERLRELGAADYFLPTMSEKIATWLAENPATPAVANEKLTELIGARNVFITEAEQLVGHLDHLDIKVQELEPGEAEIGFLLPRELFGNQFDRLIKELSVVNRIIGAFAEVATGSAETVEVRQISTSDPTFVLGLGLATIVAIGKSITWALDTWKRVDEIRRLKNEAAKVIALKGSAIEELFDKQIKDTVKEEIQKQVAAFLKESQADAGRKNELRTSLTWALESVLARVERGFAVEIRFLPPLADGDVEEAPTNEAKFQD
ncbi:hypothetical protein EOA30_23055, partial [Mesorhizobium sp. M8A.F.Ca.ET.059.01.1.1]